MTSPSLMKDDLRAWQEGVRQFEDGDVDEAYRLFCEMTEQNSNVVFNMATVHLIIGNFQEAYGLYTEVLEKDQYMVVAFYQRAVCSHWMNRNEDALEDFTKALELMRESNAIHYSSLGMDLVLCSFQIHSCLIIIKSCLGLTDGAQKSRQKAISTKKIVADDPLEKDRAANVLKNQIPTLSSILVDPCISGHRFGACPLLKLDPPPIFKPRGVAKKVLETDQSGGMKGKDFIGEQKAKVLWYSEASYNFVGFQGVKHKNELMPMFIRPGKKKKSKGVKEPPKALGGLIKAASPQLVNLKPKLTATKSSPSSSPTRDPSPVSRPRRATESEVDISTARAKAAPSPEVELELKLTRRGQSVPAILVDDRLHRPCLSSRPRSVVAIPELDEESDVGLAINGHCQRSSSVALGDKRERRASLPVDSLTNLSRSRSVEVLCAESPGSPQSQPLSHRMSTEFPRSSSPRVTSPSLAPRQSPTTEINTHLAMTPENLRGLADLLEKLQATSNQGKVAVHVHFHSEPGNGRPANSYQAA